MKKLLILHKHLRGGGAEISLINLIPILRRKGFDISVSLVFNERILKERVPVDMEIDFLFPKATTEYKRCIQHDAARIGAGLLADYDIEVAYLEGYPTAIISQSNNQSSYKVAWVHSDFRNNHHSANAFINLEAEKEAYLRFDHLVFCSHAARQGFDEIIGIAPHQKQDVFLPLPSQDDIYRFASAYSVDELTPFFCTMARLAPEKGLIRLVEAVNIIKCMGLSIRILVFGEGAERHQIEMKISEHRLQQNIVLKGFYENPYPYLKSCQAYICPSIGESFCLAAYEAKLLNKEIIACDSSGIREVLHGYPLGLIVDNNVHGLVQGLLTLLL